MSEYLQLLQPLHFFYLSNFYIIIMKNIPNFKNKEKEREFWAEADSSEYIDWKKAKKVVLPNLIRVAEELK